MSDVWDEATEKLIQFTETGKLTWAASDPPSTLSVRHEDVVGKFYTTITFGKRIAVYEFRPVRVYRDPLWSLTTTPVQTQQDRNVAIEFVDEKLRTEWSWPSPRKRFELLEAIQFAESGADHFFQEFLAATP